jgi:hypothetical protein
MWKLFLGKKIHSLSLIQGLLSNMGIATAHNNPASALCSHLPSYGNTNILTTRVSDPDPDPHGSTLIWVAGSGSRRAKMTHKNRKKYEFSCFEVLDVLFWGLKASPVAWTSFMEA